jgi:beta-lactamase superfamily II metal-dependent hydrolase
MLAGIGGLTVPHHAGRSDASPPASVDPWRAIASYGEPNSYRHPHAQTITKHQSQGWQISATATTPTHPRGNRSLFP